MNRGGRSDHPDGVVVKRRGRAIVVAMGPPYATGAQFGGKLTKRVPESGLSGVLTATPRHPNRRARL
jgi:hypothetical protein